MFGNETVLVVEVGGARVALSLDRARKLTLRGADGQERVVEPRPVVEFAGAVDREGRLHLAAWLMSRHLMYLTSADGVSFTRSTLLQGDMALRLRDLLCWAGQDPAVAYVAETDHSDTLVCYRRAGEGWEGVRVAECARPDRLHALAQEGGFGAAALLYCVRAGHETTVLRRDAAGHGGAEPVARIQGVLNDFCAVLDGGRPMACWLSDGALYINGARHGAEPWQCAFPYLMRVGDAVRCQWLEQGSLRGVVLGERQAWLTPRPAQGALACQLALPGEVRRAVVDGRTLRELVCEIERPGEPPQEPRRAGPPRAKPEEPSLTEIVRNQAIVLTRLRESMAGMERTVLKLTAEVSALRKENAALLRQAGKAAAAENNLLPEEEPAPQEPTEE